MHGRLFFGFEYECFAVYVIALAATGRAVLRLTFPLTDRGNADLDHGPAADIATSLLAFVHAYHAEPVCGTDEDPPVLAALAKRLGGPVRYLSPSELERTARPGFPPYARREPGCVAHQRALLAGLAAAEGLGDLGLGDL
jgi:hypothetical protein